MVRIRLPRELETDLALLSVLTGNSIEFHVRQAILEYLEDLDDRIAATRWIEDAIAEEREVYTTAAASPEAESQHAESQLRES